jgi:hypothetical protein
MKFGINKYLTTITIGTFALLSSISFTALATPAPEGATAYIVSPMDGATVSSPVTVVFGLKGMGVAPAGVTKEKTGHFHLIIDSELPPAGKPIGKSDKLVHFGGGQTETSVKLSKGTHTLQLLMGDAAHVPHKPAVKSEKITVTVE